MTTETGNNRGGIFVPAILPWLLGAGMFVAYALTLYHTASPASLDRLASVSGWDWRPKLFAPLTFLATYPIRWLPDHLKLAGLNLFAAACAALTLALLARSVALLPHDRTNEQRQREQSDFSLLTIRAAWLPPLFAVLVCGLQMSFWERAVEFVDVSFYDNGEMLNLLLFAYVVRCLLEYRIHRRDSWLIRSALVFGVGMANNWAMTGFFPAFVVALVWIKGFEFFQWRFVLRMFLCGIAGLCLIFFLPLLIQFGHYYALDFKKALEVLLAYDRGVLIHWPFERKWFLVLAVTSLLPVLLMGIRWAASFGDNSPLGIFIATSAVSLAHGFLLLCCLWVALDPPFGPRQMTFYPASARMPFLTFFYLGALSVGYFSGYFLLVFGGRSGKPRQRTPPLLCWANCGVCAIVWLVAIAVPSALALHNGPRVTEGRNAAVAMDRYFSRMAQALPQKGAVIISDKPNLLFYLEAALARREKSPDNFYVDTDSLSQSWDYVRELEQKHPQDGPGAVFVNRESPVPPDLDCIHLLEGLAGRHEIYYLHSSFGYYFERFYAQPQGPVCRLELYPTNAWAPPPLTPAQIQENQKFWNDATNDFAFIIQTMHPSRPPPAENVLERFRQTGLYITETNQAAVELGEYYSRSINYWGVELQKSAGLDETEKLRAAGNCFDLARQLFPENVPAQYNLDYNRGGKRDYKPPESLEEKLSGNYRYWFQSINPGGPFDEPSFCVAFGTLLRQGGNYRQAIQQFQRLQALLPDNASPSLLLAQMYLFMPNLLYAPGHPNGLNYAYPQPVQALADAAAAAGHAVVLAPANTNALYLKAYTSLQLGGYLQNHTNAAVGYPPAIQAYSNSLAATDEMLRLAVDDPNGLLLNGTALMQLGRPLEAVRPFTRLIVTQTNNARGYLIRAIAYLQADKLDAAKADYETVIKASPAAFQASFGLAEIAYRQKNVPEAIQNYEAYLTNAPPEVQVSDEYKRTQTRVKELKGAP